MACQPFQLLSSLLGLLLLAILFDKSYGRSMGNLSAAKPGAKGRIFSGVETRQGDMPFIFKYPTTKNISFDAPGCTAFLIHKKWALSSAHCVKEDGAFVVLTNTPPEPPPIIPRQIRFWYTHPDFVNEETKHQSDIAVLQLSGTTEIEPVKIANFDTEPRLLSYPDDDDLGSMLTLAGYGYDNFNYTQSKTLLKTYMYVEELCPVRWQYRDSFFWCTSAGGAGESGCGGDSGGPLMWETEDSKIAVGVYRGGRSACQFGLEPFTNVISSVRIAKYFDWIVGKLCEHKDKLPFYTYNCPST